MAIRNVYSKEEQRAITSFMEKRDSYIGWVGDEPTELCPYPVLHRTAEKELLREMATAVDPRNPLWRDAAYAAGTRWGGIIAPPMFPQRVTHGAGGLITLDAPSDIYVDRWFPGTYWEFFAPIRENDSFRVWRSRPGLVDLTRLDGKGPRVFRITSSDIKYMNQKDELVAKFQRYFDETWYPRRKGKPADIFKRYADFATHEDEAVSETNDKAFINSNMSGYIYTEEEMSYISRISEQEEIRGARIRFWEDVAVGDELTPIIRGPITFEDLAKDYAGIAGPLHIPQSGVRIGDPQAFMGSPACESFLARLVTNWMGDDGWIQKFRWLMMEHVHVGDTLIGRGCVIRKHSANGDHLVDLSLWSECLGEAQIEHAVVATVKLLSKEEV